MKQEVKVLVVGGNFGIECMFRENNNKKYIILDDQDKEPDLVCFTGGADVNPQLYGEMAIQETSYDQRRDDEDIRMWQKWPDKPKVGICRGGQFSNVMSGGSMWQHVTNHGESHLIHNLLQIPGIEQTSLMVTSTHHQMMIPGKDGHVIAIAKSQKFGENKGRSDVYKSYLGRKRPDFDTEVVWYPETKALCYQPHPEYRQHPENKEYFFKLLDHFHGM